MKRAVAGEEGTNGVGVGPSQKGGGKKERGGNKCDRRCGSHYYAHLEIPNVGGVKGKWGFLIRVTRGEPILGFGTIFM